MSFALGGKQWSENDSGCMHRLRFQTAAVQDKFPNCKHTKTHLKFTVSLNFELAQTCFAKWLYTLHSRSGLDSYNRPGHAVSQRKQSHR